MELQSWACVVPGHCWGSRWKIDPGIWKHWAWLPFLSHLSKFPSKTELTSVSFTWAHASAKIPSTLMIRTHLCVLSYPVDVRTTPRICNTDSQCFEARWVMLCSQGHSRWQVECQEKVVVIFFFWFLFSSLSRKYWEVSFIDNPYELPLAALSLFLAHRPAMSLGRVGGGERHNYSSEKVN